MPVPQQIGLMQELHPNLPMVSWHGGVVQWAGELQPTDLSEFYRVAIQYRLGIRPKVNVLRPQLRDRGNGESIPHLFPDRSLCLYLINSGEWTPEVAIAETTVPWACLWLYHYEVWRATGEWMGGGVHPPRKNH
jgi:hypothetical protein